MRGVTPDPNQYSTWYPSEQRESYIDTGFMNEDGDPYFSDDVYQRNYNAVSDHEGCSKAVFNPGNIGQS